ncbi:MAG: thiol-disulfide isomerase [Flaviaesturariibacter sp.]|nr:thiol-disulfide isomerase [Flaviaesturariibacter sp.]
MKKILFLSAAVATLGLAAFTVIDDLQIGSSLPKADVKMKDVSGKEITLKSAMGKNGLLVMFSCNTCPYVVKNQARTKENAAAALSKNIGVVLVNSNEAQRGDDDSYDAMKAYAKEQGYRWSYVVDQNSVIADAFGAKKTPECFLFDNGGKLVYHGAIDDSPSNPDAVSRQHLKVAMEELVAGKEVSVKTSSSVGCGIKRNS